MNSIERLKKLMGAKSAPAPSLVFEKEVANRARRYAELRKLVAEVLFLEARQGAELDERRAELARFHHRALIAARNGEQREARQLTRAKEDSRAALAAAEAELQQIRAAADDARELLRGAGTSLAELAKEAESVRRTERLRDIEQRFDHLRRPESPGLDQARLQIERLRAERALDAELRALPEHV